MTICLHLQAKTGKFPLMITKEKVSLPTPKIPYTQNAPRKVNIKREKWKLCPNTKLTNQRATLSISTNGIQFLPCRSFGKATLIIGFINLMPKICGQRSAYYLGGLYVVGHQELYLGSKRFQSLFTKFPTWLNMIATK